MKFNLTKINYLIFFLTLSVTAQDFDAFQYRTVGPERGGRVTTVTGTPQLPGTFYLGATGGGVWKTEDYGISWKNVSDGYFATPSIGAIEVATNDPNIVYVGTGSDGLRSNVISGKGVYKSIDAGKSWQHIGLPNVGQIGAVEIDPRNHNIVWVAAIGNAFKSNPERGIYKTTDGGKNWEKVLFISDEVGFADLEFLPNNPDIVYAAAWKAERKPWTIISGGENDEGGIYKSINGGKDWEKLENGLPKGLIGKIDLAVSAVDSSILYAIIEAPGKEGGLYKSVNQGKSFKQISSNIGLVNRPFYYINVELDPTNPNIIYSNANPLLKSVDGGISWKRMSVPHGDNHDIWLNPNNPEILIQANDGGANVSQNGGKTWSTQFNQPTAELYQVEVDDQYPYWLYAGQQDNSSTISVPSFPPSAIQYPGVGWIMNTGGCETGPAVPKPGNSNIVYANCKGRFFVFDKTTGTEKSYYVGASNIYGHNPKDLKYRFQRVAPIHVSPHNPDVVYHGSQFLHKTITDGEIWETISPDLTTDDPKRQRQSTTGGLTIDNSTAENNATIYTIAESEIDGDVLWVGSDDGLIHVSQNAGESWKSVSKNIKGVPKGTWVSRITTSSHDKGTAFVTFDGHRTGDMKTYVYQTTDFGKSWEKLSAADVGYAWIMRQDTVNPDLYFLGTEFGLYVSLDAGQNWARFKENLPKVAVHDMVIHPTEHDLILATHGRGVYIIDDISPMRALNKDKLQENMLLLPSRPSVMVEGGALQSFSGAGEFVGDNPSEVAVISYYLKKRHMFGDMKVNILDENDNIITTLVAGKRRGINRVEWPMRLKAPKFPPSTSLVPGFFGPRVAEGEYKVEIIKGKKKYYTTVELVADPRSKHTKADRQVQHDLSMKLYDSINDLTFKLSQLKDVNTQLDAIEGLSSAAKKKAKKWSDSYTALNKKYTATKVGAITGEEQLREKLGNLFGNVVGYNGKPSQTQFEQADQLMAEVKVAIKAADKVIDQQFSGINKSLEEAQQIKLLERGAWNEKNGLGLAEQKVNKQWFIQGAPVMH